MGAHPDLTTRLVKQPTARTRTGRAHDTVDREPALRLWWASYIVLWLGIGFALLWSIPLVPRDKSLGDGVAIAGAVASLFLMVLSAVVAVQLGERAGATARDAHGVGRRRWRAAVRCWWGSFALAALGVVSQVAWNDDTPPYDSFGESLWFLWMVGTWCLLLFSAAVAGIFGEARAQRESTAEVVRLRASRGRLVDASDAARRAIERDLHDGVQPRLVALMMKVNSLRRSGTVAGSDAVMSDIEHELQEILGEIRALASGILPPALTDLGLDAAVTELTACMPFPVDLEMPAERMGARAEVTAYFVIAEALTNAAKHADPDRVAVRVTVRDRWAVVEVHDDGRGGADAGRGTGLLGLADRVDTLDGCLTVVSRPGQGTTVIAEFSCTA
jgi:signal transduction histidine kinase